MPSPLEHRLLGILERPAEEVIGAYEATGETLRIPFGNDPLPKECREKSNVVWHAWGRGRWLSSFSRIGRIFQPGRRSTPVGACHRAVGLGDPDCYHSVLSRSRNCPPSRIGGLSLRAAQDHMETALLVAVFPGLAIFYAALEFNLFGDGLRDILDPRIGER